MKIGVSGASGKLGKGVLQHLARHPGIEIVGISRTPDPQAAFESRFGDFDQPDSLGAAFAGLDRLLIIPTMSMEPGRRGEQNVVAIDAANSAGVGHVVFMSSAGTRAPGTGCLGFLLPRRAASDAHGAELERAAHELLCGGLRYGSQAGARAGRVGRPG